MRIWAINKKIKLDGANIVVGKKKIPIRRVYEVWIGPDSIDNRGIYKLLKRRVMIYLFDKAGLVAFMAPFRTSYGLWTGKTTIAQSKTYEDTEKRNKIAREIVSAIIHNISSVFYWYIRKKVNAEVREGFYEEIRKAKKCLGDTTDYMLCEARAWRALFRVLREIYPDFGGRIRRPPADPVNALISYVNSLLYAQCLHAILICGLDPMISFVHSPSPKRRFSLPLDIKDIFMPFVTIRLVLKLRSMLPDNFFVFGSYRGRRACFLGKKARMIVIREFRSLMRKRFRGKRLYNIIVDECEKLMEYIMGHGEYHAWRIRK